MVCEPDNLSQGARDSDGGIGIATALAHPRVSKAVRLESAHAGRTRYLVVVSREGRTHHEESCLLGIDCSGAASTVGLVLRVLADTAITLDGDGGFSVSVCGRQHIFKPVSVQAMWSALQTLHKVSSKAREHNFFLGGLTHDWVEYYEQRIESDRSCLNEWHAMDNLESRRPPSPDSVRSKPREREETERVIRCTLKEIMMSVDLDEVTSKYIRGRLEDQLDMDLTEFKSFIDQEMLTILGQMDAATEIFDHIYLGSEWNASNLEELQKNGVRHILNVTREIDNFFPGMFNYLNVRVYDDEKTDLLKHWDNTYKYITRARKEGSKVLVHCKMGVSRSASVVIAYAMKAYNWDFKKALDFVRQKRSCIKPNTSFVSQLETYQGILDAMKNREKLQRSKSETNLKSPGLVAKAEATSVGPTGHILRTGPSSGVQAGSPLPPVNSAPAPPRQTDPIAVPGITEPSGRDLACCGGRPKSWSPDNTLVSTLFTSRQPAGPTSVSLEHLNTDGSVGNSSDRECGNESVSNSSDSSVVVASTAPSEGGANPAVPQRNYNANVRMPCANGLMYSVSQNKVVHLPGSSPAPNMGSPVPLVKRRVTALETAARAGLVLNLTSQFEACDEDPAPPAQTWDPGELPAPEPDDSVMISLMPVSTAPSPPLTVAQDSASDSRLIVEGSLEKTVQTRKPVDPFSNQVDRVFDREERKQQRVAHTAPATPTITEGAPEPSGPRDCPSRQSSWSSYDSAVVLREAPSRQSSWGSGDTRWGTLPSRNSSWGSYDMRPGVPPVDSSSNIFPYEKDDIPWHPGTVRRTRQRIEEGKEVKAVSVDSENPPSVVTSTTTASLRLHTPRPYLAPSTALKSAHSKSTRDSKIVHYASSPTLSSRGSSEDDVLGLLGSPPSDKIAVSQPNITLYHSSAAPSEIESCLSVSAPAATSLCLVPEVAKCSVSSDELVTSASADVPGKVKNLKKEFEAKSVGAANNGSKDAPVTLSTDRSGEGRVRSVPSSPVSVHSERDQSNAVLSPVHSPVTSAEDLSVKVLVGKYEVGKVLGPVNTGRTRITAENDVPRKVSQPPVPPRKSSFEVQNNTSTRHSSLLVNNLRNGGSCVGGGGGMRVRPTPAKGSIPSPSVVVASVVAKAASKKQQQGKTHPLARLTLSKVPRHNNPVYNTM